MTAWITLAVIVAVSFVFVALVRAWFLHGLRCQLTDETIDWMFESYAWLLRNLGGFEKFVATEFPTVEDFHTEHVGHSRAEQVFEAVRETMGVSHWPCRLVRSDALVPEDDGSHVRGTFLPDFEEGEAIVTYDEGLDERLDQLVAVLAHEISHYVLLAVPEDSPGGDDQLEPLTDLCSAFLGFAIIASNVSLEAVVGDEVRVAELVRNPSIVRFQQLAYLGLPGFTFALAIAASLLDRREELGDSLELPARLHYVAALRHIDRHRAGDVEALREARGDDVRAAQHPILDARRYLEHQRKIRELEDLLEKVSPRRSRKPRRERKRRKNP